MKKDELRQKISTRKLGDRKHLHRQEHEGDEGADNILQEIQGDLMRYEDKEFAVIKKDDPPPAPPTQNMKKVVNTGINLINQKYKKSLSHPELDESIEMEASKLADKLHDKGYSERKKGNLQNAINYYSQALDLCPDHQTVLSC